MRERRRNRHTHITKSTLKDGEQGRYYESPSFMVFDLMMRYHLIQKEKSNVVLFSRVDNVTNMKYYNVNVGTDDGLTLTPQDPIRVLFGANYTF